jgi:hypothetical protein
MTGRIGKTVFIKHCRSNLSWICSILLSIILLTACSTATTTTTQPTAAATNTEIPPPLPTLYTAIPTSFSTITATPEILATLPSPPTAHAYYFMQIGQLLKFLNIYMIDEQTGWAIDAGDLNHILRTRDGGRSWRDVTPYFGYGIPRYFADGFFALDANTAWAMTPEMPACDVQNWNCIRIPDTALMWHTTDGGRTWQGQFIAAVPLGSMPMSIQFLDAHTGWLLAMSFNEPDRHYHLYQTTDGGTNWSEIMDVSSSTAPEVLREKDITAIAFQDSQTGWMSTSEICCEEHLIKVKEWNIYRSTDAGVTWDKFFLPAPDPLPETFLHNTAQCAVQDMQVILPSVLETTFYCYVYEGLSKSYFYFHYHSGDGGDHWVSFQQTGNVQFIDASLGWRMTPKEGAYDLERTQDGGVTWTKLKTVHWNGRLDFVNKFVGWALAGSNDDFTFLHTGDGGRTWEEIKPVVSPN